MSWFVDALKFGLSIQEISDSLTQLIPEIIDQTITNRLSGESPASLAERALRPPFLSGTVQPLGLAPRESWKQLIGTLFSDC